MTSHSQTTLPSQRTDVEAGPRDAEPSTTASMRIAIVVGNVPSDMMGGAEYQSMLLAEELSRRGHQVAFIASSATSDQETTSGGLTIFRIGGVGSDATATLRRKLGDVVTRFAPDLCYVRIFTQLAVAAEVCRAAGIPLVSASSAGYETSPIKLSRSLRSILRQYRCFRAIRSAEVHCCNTQSLQAQVRRWLPSARIETIYNGQRVPELDEESKPASSGRIVWVNNLKRWKRPQLVIELARRLPQYRFAMIGRMAEGRFGRQIARMLDDAPANLQYLGSQPVEEVNRQIIESDLLLNTSRPLEGFSNSLMQAWFRCRPTVTLSVDVDGIIRRERLGCCCQSMDELTGAIDQLMQDESLRLEMGQRARSFAVAHLSQETMVAKYEALFAGVVQRNQASNQGGRASRRPS